MTNNLIAPLTRALYGKRVACQVGGGYGFSQRMASALFQKQFLWEGEAARFAIDSWLTTVAVAEGFQVWQARLGAKVQDHKAGAADVATSLVQAVGASYHYMEHYQDVWEKPTGSSAVPEIGKPMEPEVESAPIQVERMMKGFRQGLRDLLPIWEVILAPETLAGVLALGLKDDEDFRFPLALWVQTVYDFAVALSREGDPSRASAQVADAVCISGGLRRLSWRPEAAARRRSSIRSSKGVRPLRQ